MASPLRLELFHYIQKVIVDLRLVTKLQFHLVQVGQSIFHLWDREGESQFHQSVNLFSFYIFVSRALILSLKTMHG